MEYIKEENIFIISDLHFFDKNIINYCNRPFIDINQMNEYLLRQIDNLPANSLLWNLGDLSMNNNHSLENLKPIVERMHKNNKKLYIILGNHDRHLDKKYKKYTPYTFYKELGFDKVYEHPIILEHYNIILSHEPLFITKEMPYFNIHGHIHNTELMSNCFNMPNNTDINHYMNACVEATGYTPINFSMILNELQIKFN